MLELVFPSERASLEKREWNGSFRRKFERVEENISSFCAPLARQDLISFIRVYRQSIRSLLLVSELHPTDFHDKFWK